MIELHPETRGSHESGERDGDNGVSDRREVIWSRH